MAQARWALQGLGSTTSKYQEEGNQPQRVLVPVSNGFLLGTEATKVMRISKTISKPCHILVSIPFVRQGSPGARLCQLLKPAEEHVHEGLGPDHGVMMLILMVALPFEVLVHITLIKRPCPHVRPGPSSVPY